MCCGRRILGSGNMLRIAVKYFEHFYNRCLSLMIEKTGLFRFASLNMLNFIYLSPVLTKRSSNIIMPLELTEIFFQFS